MPEDDDFDAIMVVRAFSATCVFPTIHVNLSFLRVTVASKPWFRSTKRQ
jgi:hypothetical protein